MTDPISEDLKVRIKAPWEAGDFGAIANSVGAPIARDFAMNLEASVAAKILDVACGTGGVTIPLARRGFAVTGLDISPKLLSEAQARAASEGLEISFDEGLIEALPYGDGSFNKVVSLFGIMFSPLPDQAVHEVARVLKPEGGIVLGNWMEAGFSGKMKGVMKPYLPRPKEESVSPDAWGEASYVRGRLAPWFNDIETEVVAAPWLISMPPREAARFFIKCSGQLQLLIPAVGNEKAQALSQVIEELFVVNNKSNEPRYTLIENMYLRVKACRNRAS
ncbi:class I SAM-dependent methyltransferase [Neorhizobium sp. DAR64861/K0K2]|uniref:class I SAM-dependent methyltransferase n=1 Tax=unclassified Neorhizobium TaxID=2629175 RepID=UPI003D2A739C